MWRGSTGTARNITPRYAVEELAGTLEPVRKRMAELEKENGRLRGLVAAVAVQ